MACAFFLLAGTPVYAQCSSGQQGALLASSDEQETVRLKPSIRSLPQELHSSAIPHELNKCREKSISRHFLSKEELSELRRAVREHAKNYPLRANDDQPNSD